MRVLANVRPTAEQLPILRNARPGVVLIRGAAGSGKTTTAVKRLEFVTGFWLRQRSRAGSTEPIHVLVLTYNRTLRGYVEELVYQHVRHVDRLSLKLDTFGRWAWQIVGQPEVLEDDDRENRLWLLGHGLGYSRDFLVSEIDYVMGRFLPGDLGLYADPSKPQTFERTGRGLTPRVERPQREEILQRVIEPYIKWKDENGYVDWNDIALQMMDLEPDPGYEIVVVDEAQDFSANQIRAVKQHFAPNATATFVLDAVQRIYPRGFRTWREVAITLTDSYRLSQNHRNTKQIAAFAYPLVEGLPLEDDGTLPEFEETERDGPLPIVVRGAFAEQMAYIVDFIGDLPDDESVALLHAKGGGWFNYARARLRAAGLDFVEITQRREWPRGPEEIALCTLHSAKGLEFDHIIILGLNAELMPHGPEETDTQLAVHRRLVAMGIGRARSSVLMSYKPGEESRVVHLLDPGTYQAVDV